MNEIIAKNKRTLKISLFVALLMLGFGFALVPLYNVFCKVTGINGKTGGAVAVSSGVPIDKTRNVTVEFLSTNNANLPWDFHPIQKKVKLHPGEMVRVAFFGKNFTDHAMTIQAIPSVSPGEAAKYLKKTECFCFTRQTLKGGESHEFPILFHIDPKLPKKIHTLTLSYTIFDVSNFATKNSGKKAGRIS